jgi:hypothetical protein
LAEKPVVTVSQEKRGDAVVWVVRVPLPNGKVQEFTCAAEAQAHKLIAAMRR